MAPRALVAVEYAWGQRTARVDRAPHGWVVRCSVVGGRDWFAERGDSYTARTVARDWVEGRLQGPHHHPRRRGEGPMRRLVQAGLMAMVVLGMAALAQAQSVNPRAVAWDYPPEDHERVTRYELGYYLTGAATPFTTVDIAKTSVTAEDVDSWRTGLPRPAFGQFTARLRAHYTVAGGGEAVTAWSDPTGPFSLSPPIPAGLRTPQ